MTEGEIQRAVFAHLKERGVPGVVFWHCPNDIASRRKSGYLAGVSDVNAVHRGKFYAMELKTEKGESSPDQDKYIARINGTGGHACVANGLNEAICLLEKWGLVRPEAA